MQALDEPKTEVEEYSWGFQKVTKEQFEKLNQEHAKWLADHCTKKASKPAEPEKPESEPEDEFSDPACSKDLASRSRSRF